MSRTYNHLNWYIQEAFQNIGSNELAMTNIQSQLRNSSNIKIHKATILKYNSGQFDRYQTAPLEWVGDDIYRLNENYYRLLGERVCAPRMGKPGRPKRYTTIN